MLGQGFGDNFSGVSLNGLSSRSAFGSSFVGNETVLGQLVLDVSFCGVLDLL